MEDSQVEQAIHDLGHNPTLANFISKFGLFTQAPNGISKLRELILFAAVSGKLTHKETEADIEDEIQQALAYKAKYEMELKLRKNTPLASVEIIPYEIPSHWQWVKLEDLACYIQRGKGPKYDDDNSSELVISQKCIQWDGFSLDKSRGVLASSLDKYGEERFLKQGDLLWNSTGTGTVGRIAVIDKNIKERLVADSHVTVIRFSNMVPRYIWCCITNPWVQDRIKPEHENALVSGSTKQVELSTTAVRGLPIPVAPIEEQKRIVSKVDELMALCDQLEAQQQQQANTLLKANTAAIQALLSSENSKDDLKNNWQRLADNFHTLYGNTLPMPPGEGRQKKHLVGFENLKQLRKVILQLAINGKLVQFNNSKNTAKDELNEIYSERTRIIAEEKFKPLFEMKTDFVNEEPFSIPENWTWCYLDDIAAIARGGSPRPIKSYLTDDENGLNWIKIGDSERGSVYIESAAEKIIPEGLKKTREVIPGDLILSNSISFGYPYILKISGCIHDGWLVIRTPKELVNKLYLYYLLLSPYAMQEFTGSASGAVVQNLNADKVKQLPIPLPPLEEQSLIVSRVEELMALCDLLEQKLMTSYKDAEKLIEATIKKLVA